MKHPGWTNQPPTCATHSTHRNNGKFYVFSHSPKTILSIPKMAIRLKVQFSKSSSAKIGDHFYKPDDQGIYGAYILCSVYLKKDCFKFTHAFLAKFFKVNLSAFSNLKERANKQVKENIPIIFIILIILFILTMRAMRKQCFCWVNQSTS